MDRNLQLFQCDKPSPQIYVPRAGITSNRPPDLGESPLQMTPVTMARGNSDFEFRISNLAARESGWDRSGRLARAWACYFGRAPPTVLGSVALNRVWR